MGIGTSLVLIAIGAILKWAVHASVSGLNLQAIGVILIVVGVIGLVLSLLWMRVWSRGRPGAPVDEGPYVP